MFMKMDKEQYRRYVRERAPRSPVAGNCIKAFLIGGGICTLAQLLLYLYCQVCGMERQDGATLVSVTLIALAILLTGLGVFDHIAKVAGAGTLVPITGFANAVASPAFTLLKCSSVAPWGRAGLTVASCSLPLYMQSVGAVRVYAAV